jgi:hypothetical protein
MVLITPLQIARPIPGLHIQTLNATFEIIRKFCLRIKGSNPIPLSEIVISKVPILSSGNPV